MLHPWMVSVAEARQIQETLRDMVLQTDCFSEIRLVAGVDVSYARGAEHAVCAIAVLSFPGLEMAGCSHAAIPPGFPYLPGLLAFREGPLIEAAYQRLNLKPDIFLFDGHGVCHPQSFGIASHLGVYLALAGIGCAKENLCGSYVEPGPARGDTSPIMDGGMVIGYAVRTREKTKPVFVSVGHKVSLESAVDICLRCSSGYRIPEPLRQAHIMSRKILTAQCMPSRVL